jgi:hypothetical protein
MQQVEAYRLAHSTQKTASEVLKQIYKELITQALATSADVSAEKIFYTAQNLMKVINRVQGLAKQYPPTHRKGVGKDGGVLSLTQEPWMWYFEGNEGGGTGGGSGEDEGEPDFGDLDSGIFDWAPQGEQDRARAMLYQVAAETGFGPGDDPLAFVDTVARCLGGRWGLNGKRGNPNDPSRDVLAWDIPGHPPQLFDVLVDSGGANKISWQPLRYGPGAVWIRP